MRFISIIFFFLVIGIQLSGQTAKAFEKAGDKAFKNKDYGAALEYYRNAMEINQEKISTIYKYAEVARMFYAYDFAVDYYKKVKNSKEAEKYPLTDYWLGQVHLSIGFYTEAISYFNNYLNNSGNSTFEKQAQKAIISCDWALEVINNEDDIEIQQLNKRVNTPYSEFGPLLRGDTLFYTSFQFDNLNDEHDPPRKISKVMTSIKGSKGKPLKRKFNEQIKLTAHTTFSLDGNRIYYTLCQYKAAMDIQCDICYRDKDVKRKRWGKTQKLPDFINKTGTSSTHPNIGKDNITGEEILFYSSNRPDGKGKLDIWWSAISKAGKFSEPQNLNTINTAQDELTPYFHKESNTLFFSSDGHQGLGGYDIYKTTKSKDYWMEVIHTGYPLNSSYNDVYFSLNSDSTIAYLSSNRLGSMYLEPTNKSCCNDIYKVVINQKEAEKPPTDSLSIVEIPVKPPVIEIEGFPKVEIPPTTLEDFLPLALYFDNDEPDKRTRRNTTKKSYLKTFEPYYTRRDEFRREYAGGLDGEQKLIAESDVDVFFENKVKRGGDYLELFSDILLKRLEEGEEVEIFVKGYTSPRAESDYNIHLGKRRISSVKNHFKTYQNNLFESYLKSGKLIISERSFGETTARSDINDDLNNQRLSIYSPEASVERRVEIVEIIRQ
ncbi:MAG: tetratricopeptide (TPR) repeat protein [Saprospiraceae bacterium]|jgi:tetratricopeptide (TPR) repeat protein